MTFLRRFFQFWYDFLVGDRWELFLGPLAALAIVAAAASAGLAGIAGALLFLLVAGVAAFSVAWAVR